ncbi:hypothetical protein MLD38_035335 [Melastoma candidum]|uniref:Uncharacterized protein n=1 Tax=Melastoma candidum TaxID=119954 RepID=A0ACB9LFW1_9MYRT|nr:hypothetical protein MLD38_035335 [Melastoma candidum]
MGSDDYSVKIRKIEGCDSVCGAVARVSRGPPGTCSSAAREVTKAVGAIDMLSSHKNGQTNVIKCEEQLSSVDSGELSRKIEYVNGNSAHHLRQGEFQSPCKARKVSQTSLTSFVKPRPSHTDGFSGPSAIDNFKDLFKKSLKRSISLVDNNDLVGQRSLPCDRRVERKASKLSSKSKHDSTIMKACGSTSFTFTSGGNNLLGLYGLKSSDSDITQLADDLSIVELLEGTFENPSSSNEKTKKFANSNDSIMPLVRKAFSVLQPLKPAKSENLEGSDTVTSNKMSTDIQTSVPMDEGCNGDDNGEPSTTEMCTASKNYGNSETPDRQSMSFQSCLFQPKDLWDKLEPTAPIDLDSLILEGSKSALPSRSLSDPRLGKPVAKHGCLPAFTWSNAFNGISRSSSDAAKLLNSRNSCQAKWTSIATTCSFSVNSGDCYSNLDSIQFKEDLVPLVQRGKAMPLSKIFSQEPSIAPKQEGISTSSAVCPLSSNSHQTDKERHCPIIFAAAQTLYRISMSSSRGNVELFKPSKLIKQEKPKWSKKPEEAVVNAATSGSKNRSQGNELTPLKKSRISNIELTYRKTSISWSAPRSSRSSQSLSIRESLTSISKQPCTVTPASRALGKAFGGHKRQGRSIPLFWGRRDGLG